MRNGDVARLHLVAKKRESFSNKLVEGHGGLLRCPSHGHSADSPDDIRRAPRVGDHARRELACFIEIRLRPVEPLQPGFPAYGDRREGLLELMGDRRDKLAQRRDACGVCEIRLDLLQPLLRRERAL